MWRYEVAAKPRNDGKREDHQIFAIKGISGMIFKAIILGCGVALFGLSGSIAVAQQSAAVGTVASDPQKLLSATTLIGADRADGHILYFLSKEDGVWLLSNRWGTIGKILDANGAPVRDGDTGVREDGNGGWILVRGERIFHIATPYWDEAKGATIVRALAVEVDGATTPFPVAGYQDKTGVWHSYGKPLTLSAHDAAAWGVYAELAGKLWSYDFIGRHTLVQYDWIVPSALLQVKYKNFRDGILEDESTSYMYMDRDVHRLYSGPQAWSTVRSDGSVLTKNSGGSGMDAIFALIDGVPTSNLYKEKDGRLTAYGRPLRYLQRSGSIEEASEAYLAQYREEKQNSDNGLMATLSGAIMGAATGYADSGGDMAGAIAGAMGGAAVGASGGNDAQYAYMEQRRAEVTADAEASERQFQRTIARAQSGNAGGSTPNTATSAPLASSTGGPSSSTAASAERNASSMSDVEVWCYATRVEPKRFTEMIGSRSVERVESIHHAYISPLTTKRVSYEDRFQDRFETQWAGYLNGRGIAVDRSGCNIGSGQFAYHNTSQGPSNPLTRLNFVPQ